MVVFKPTTALCDLETCHCADVGEAGLGMRVLAGGGLGNRVTAEGWRGRWVCIRWVTGKSNETCRQNKPNNVCACRISYSRTSETILKITSPPTGRKTSASRMFIC